MPVPTRALPAAASPDAFPADRDFPQLALAHDPALMLDVFRAHLKPVAGRPYHIEDCKPFRFRCRQSTSRCVLQYTLRLVDPSSGRSWDQWVTGLLYARDGEAKRLWREMRVGDPRREIPERWLTFEPVDFIPDLDMVVQVFPYDRKLRQLSRVMDGALRDLEPLLLRRLEPGHWRVAERTIEPTRYRTELGAALRYTLQVHDGPTPGRRTLRGYLKVYRDDRGERTFERLRSLAEKTADGRRPYATVQPLGYWPELRTVALEEAPGITLQQLLLHGGDPTPALRAVGRAVAAFNQDDLGLTRRTPLADQLDDLGLASTLVQWACPAARADVQAITAAVVAGLADEPPAPIHGDLKTDHIFVSGDRVLFIDLDSAALGDPVRDPAHLFAYVAGGVGLDAMPPEQARAAAAAFAEEYFRHVPASWRRRFALHCAGALIEVASGIFRRQDARWPDKMAVAIEGARHALAEGVR